MVVLVLIVLTTRNVFEEVNMKRILCVSVVMVLICVSCAFAAEYQVNGKAGGV